MDPESSNAEALATVIEFSALMPAGSKDLVGLLTMMGIDDNSTLEQVAAAIDRIRPVWCDGADHGAAYGSPR